MSCPEADGTCRQAGAGDEVYVPVYTAEGVEEDYVETGIPLGYAAVRVQPAD